ncbi:MAG: phasin family protein [Anaerolineales bacterium]|jgi:poly(hydroxyalkanoate) granule-associated protein
MAEQTKKAQVEEIPLENSTPFYNTARRVLLASIGAIALAQDEIEDFVNKLIERGEIAEKEGKSLIREVMERRKKDALKAEDEFNKRMEEVLERMKVPSKSDIDELGEKITELSKKIDSLNK